MNTFSIARLPRIEFGSGAFSRLPNLIESYGKSILLVTGKQSFQSTSYWGWLLSVLKEKEISFKHCTIAGEPSPELIDDAVQRFKPDSIDVVIGIGGGSALDAAKAIAGLLRIENSIMDFLEGVGPELTYSGPAVPLIAVPTTAGTGSEATKNAVLSKRGEDGFKKSFRDDQLVAEYAIVDPCLLASCSSELIAANGMDALTQLMESYVSTKSNSLTDALAIDGLCAIRDSLLPWFLSSNHTSEHFEQGMDEQEYNEQEIREKMAYAALISGVTLAQTGLGSVHGLASPLGAYYPIPHGIACGTLVAEASRINIDAMLSREPSNPALLKYARLGEILCDQSFDHPDVAREALIGKLHDWTMKMRLPGLGQYGVNVFNIDKLILHSRGSSMKTNPVVLTDVEIRALLENRL